MLPAEAIAAAAARHAVTPEAIEGRGRTGAVAAARAAVWCWLRARGWSYPEIGAAWGRDHTTIMSAVRKHGGAAPLVVGGADAWMASG